MARIFTGGDLHGNQNGEYNKLSKDNFSEQLSLTKEDVYIQLGDFGFVWYYPESTESYKRDISDLNKIADKKFTTLVVPGNHENYDIINNLPIVEKWGGKVYELVLRKHSIYFAFRGEVYTINGKTIFTFSGAKTSSEANRFTYAQFLSKEKVRKKKYRYGELKKVIVEKVKLKEVSIWDQEVSTEAEKEYARLQLEKVNYKVDMVCAHTAPSYVIKELIHITEDTKQKIECDTAKFFDEISNVLEFKEWRFGHLHNNYSFIDGEELYLCHYNKPPIEYI